MSTIAGSPKKAFDVLDSAFMERAFELARRGRGATSPNPVVGAVIVKDGEVVGAGYHERYGGPHAEVNAIAEAGEKTSGATLYVTLEPCCISGNTPPCTNAVIAAGISRVVVPIEDPNPKVSGRGLSILREAGVEVDFGLMRDAARTLNAPYFKFRRTALPFTTLKLALSLDGRIAPPTGGPRWTSSRASRALVHSMRAEADCVMVGVGTVLADDPRLTARRVDDAGPGAGDVRQPVRLVLDTHLRVPLDSEVVTGAREVRTIVAGGENASGSAAGALEEKGVEIWRCKESDGTLDLRDVLKRAASDGLISVLAEGGATVATSLLSDGLVDRVAFFVAPRLYGAAGLPALASLDERWWGGGSRFVGGRWTEIGGDCLFEADVLTADPEAAEEE
ncbi:MAG: bifunctional diaminohydroxyphosphoribosylaminopyrimidine deaminase/5-amino-6-(5-phosphoribosylamino)uracil reductase RibD [Candidatus Eisenbacteria bacterium]